MKKYLFFVLMISSISYSQDEKPKTTFSKKGSFYAYWGWNRSVYSASNISFKGNNYDFTLYDVKATDRQSPFEPRIYLNPANLTIPQYNLRLGYFINDKYQISLGVDHMKYVMKANQMSSLSGHIENTGTEFDGVYDKTPFQIVPQFLCFEHTDGLNYINSEIRRVDQLFEKGIFRFNLSEGAGAGILLPRTNTTLLNNPRYDQFHLAGFGLCGIFALNIEFYNRFFIQSEIKAGFIDMPSIRTTMFKTDKAKQNFTFLQSNVVFGVRFNTKKK